MLGEGNGEFFFILNFFVWPNNTNKRLDLSSKGRNRKEDQKEGVEG